MLTFETLNKNNLKNIEKYSIQSAKFNSLNKKFLSVYNKSTFFQKVFLKKRAVIFKIDNIFSGFLWSSSFKDMQCYIEELYVLPKINLNDLKKFSNLFSPYSKIIYKTEDNDYNIEVLPQLGFNKINGIIEMELFLDNYRMYFDKLHDNLEVEIFKEGVHENLRCNLQNEIFKSHDRIDLKVKDIYEDERQDYYIKNGGIFLKHNGEYIGYAQIIKENNFITIVNLGIIPSFRNKGFGKILIGEVIKLIKILNPYENVIRIKVYSNNYIAFNLYKKLGFTVNKTTSLWEIK